ncbi:hypothetical protein LBMAG51_00940 [Phycisphaerae bacterium]|nr:hypothetical protein LBMAG51_00940 [Phycisphaerae bacterium]
MTDSAPSNIWKSPSWVRIGLAMAIALVSDGLSFFLSPTVIAEPLVIGIDLVTGVLIWLALGRPILLFAVFLAEAIPGVGMIPLWTMVVAILATTGRLPSRMGAMTSSQKNSPNDPANPPPTPPNPQLPNQQFPNQQL